MRDTDVAWAAGFVDGEASVQLDRKQRKTHPKTHPEYQLSVRVSQTKRAPLDELSQLFGGNVVSRCDMWGEFYVWSVTGARAAEVLAQLRPHLRVKASHADVGLRHWARRPSRKPDRIADERDYIEMKALNRRRTRR